MSAVLILILIPVTFLVVVLAISWSFAVSSGWRALYDRYGPPKNPVPKCKTFLSGKVGGVNYRNMLFVATDTDGIYLGTILFTRVSHPTLYIPWKEFHHIRHSRHVLRDQVVATIGEPRITTVHIPRRAVRATYLDPMFSNRKAS